ncbi:hypothetical protein MESS2_1030142 [Mesorhizobium metallidurans STM 2683]|uniref:Uncharacterized protein n=1 Tax=Mesorhizobium metallidurans STM 2683 TaxID=1297569 RepID=M5EGA6_9HYPH|nr:hypothetical protein MESS2_1030142 [Mesorhizobium metallidurans STM 2683]
MFAAEGPVGLFFHGHFDRGAQSYTFSQFIRELRCRVMFKDDLIHDPFLPQNCGLTD